MTADEIIRQLKLKPLPVEGGWYRETWRSPEKVRQRACGTAIYYLLTPDTFSAMHRLASDEVYHFYLGDAVEMLLLRDGIGRRVVLGPNLQGEQQVQQVVEAGTWQGSRLVEGGGWALLGTTMAPGFDFTDFTLGEREALVSEYSAWAELISKLTRADTRQE